MSASTTSTAPGPAASMILRASAARPALRHTMMTSAPRRANSVAAANPIPELAPVITAVGFSISRIPGPPFNHRTGCPAGPSESKDLLDDARLYP